MTVRRYINCAFLAGLALPMMAGAAMGRDSFLTPDSWGGKLSVGYEDRAIDGDVSGDPATGTGPPRYWYTEPDDFLGLVNVWSRWKFRPFRYPTKLKFEYERRQWAEGDILARDIFILELRQDLSPKSRLDLEVEHTPQIYNTHRVDKDAQPGQPRFRPEAYQETEAALAFLYRWAEDFSITTFTSYTARDETPWFRERDRRRLGAGFSLDFLLQPQLRVIPEYEFRSNSSRNEPDLGADLSYREHSLDLKLSRPGVGPLRRWQLDVESRLKFRHYTTDDQEDTRRYRRVERIYAIRLVLRLPFETVTPFASWEAAGRSINVPGDVAEVDEADDIERTLIQLGIEWRFDRP